MRCNHSGKRWFKNGAEEEYQKNMGSPVNCLFDCGGKIDKKYTARDRQHGFRGDKGNCKKVWGRSPIPQACGVCTGHISGYRLYETCIQWLYENEGKVPEYLVHMRPTTPIRSPKIIEEAIIKIQNDKEATSLRSGHLCHHPPYKWFKENGEYWEPLISGMTCDEVNMPRQDFPSIYIPNGYVDVVKADVIVRENLLHGDKMIGYRTNEIPDIDTELDLKKMLIFDDVREDISVLRKELEKSCGDNKS